MLFIIYFIFLCFIACYELFRNKKSFIDFMTIFNMFFIFDYLIPVLIFNYDITMYHEWRFLEILPEAGSSFLVMLMIVLSYISLIVGYTYSMYNNKYQYEMSFKYGEKSQFYIMVAFFLIFMISFLMYSQAQGGIAYMIMHAKDIRAGRLSAGGVQYLVYLADMLVISMIIFLSFWKLGIKPRIRKVSKYLFFISFIFSLLYALSTGGRANIGMVFLLILFFMLNIYSQKINLKKLFIFGAFGIFIFILVKYGKSVIWSLPALEGGVLAFLSAVENHYAWYVAESSNILESSIGFARNKDHAIASIYAILQNNELYEVPRLFFDWIRGVIDILPGVGWVDLYVSDTPSAINRDFFGKDGYVPPGFVAMKLMNGGVLWLVVGSFIAGIVGAFLSKAIYRSWNNSPLFPAYFILIAFFWKDNIVGPDPFMVFLPNIVFIVVAILYLSIVIFKKTGVNAEA
jgi:hypothetical protein